MITSPRGTTFNSIIGEFKPCFIWDAYQANQALGLGLDGSSLVPCTITDLDSISPADDFSAWDSGNERYQVYDVSGGTELHKAFGTVGDFSDGKVQNYWGTSWSTTTLGFSVSSPTTGSMLGEVTGTKPDIIEWSSSPDVTYVDTTEVNDSVIERSRDKSSSYLRVFQILIKSNDGNDPSGNVEIGMNSTSGTRTTDAAGTWFRELPGSRGWWAALYTIAGGSPTTNYMTMKFKSGSGRWLLAAPMWYNGYSSFGNIVRSPIPVDSSSVRERGAYQIVTTNTDFAIPVSGWMAGCIVLPDRGVASGHLDYSGSGDYSFGPMMEWQSGTYRIRMFMSNTNDYVAIQMDNADVSFAYLEFDDDWNDFQPWGYCVTWGYSLGKNYAYLYVDGESKDSVYDVGDWYPNNLSTADIYIGAVGTSGADCWLPKMIFGRQPMHRVQARILSSKMGLIARSLA